MQTASCAVVLAMLITCCFSNSEQRTNPTRTSLSSSSPAKRYVIESRDATQRQQVAAIVRALQTLQILTTDSSTCFTIDDITVTSRHERGSGQEIVLSLRQSHLSESHSAPGTCASDVADVTTMFSMTSNSTEDYVVDSNSTIGNETAQGDTNEGEFTTLTFQTDDLFTMT